MDIDKISSPIIMGYTTYTCANLLLSGTTSFNAACIPAALEQLNQTIASFPDDKEITFLSLGHGGYASCMDLIIFLEFIVSKQQELKNKTINIDLWDLRHQGAAGEVAKHFSASVLSREPFASLREQHNIHINFNPLAVKPPIAPHL